jgi:macrolide transport system ATP-binding/permease protein
MAAPGATPMTDDRPAGPPLISLSGAGRSFVQGDATTTVLDGIDLDLWPGEMVAIVGASGSGKSTLMNILGLLDRPDCGTYRFAGQDVGQLPDDDRARLRREHFGFIFQRYQLLPDLDALSNVEVPAVYRGSPRRSRRDAARAILARLGLSDRLHHRPGALSGGQQQRVSVARALMNGGEVILADEPTGALDTRSGAELMALLKDLNARGHTIVIVTHDPAIAAQAGRIVEIRDGRILSDRRTAPARAADRIAAPLGARGGLIAAADRLAEAFAIALKAMAAHRLRSFLTMLGIIIGIAAVVSVVALGNGSKERVLADIAQIGSSTIDVRPGTGFGDRRASSIRTLVPADADALALQPYAVSVSPEVTTTATVIHGAASASARVRGVGQAYFDLGAFTVESGQVFHDDHIADRAQVAVIDTAAQSTLFAGGSDPVGQTILIGRVPVRVIGLVSEAGVSFGPQTIGIYLPYTTVATRITGQTDIDQISVRIADDFDMAAAETQITTLIRERHGKQDFFLTNSDTIRQTITSTTETLTLLVAAIAVISLVVGGVGVMNIMLVSVTERTREIGVRMSVGARRSDIVTQFLIEAVLVSLAGGVIGVLIALGAGWTAQSFFPAIPFAFSPSVAVAAFVACCGIGIVFGWLPARTAARLDPVAALARE